MIYSKYANARIEKRFWEVLGFKTVISGKSSGWKVKLVGFKWFERGSNHG